MTKALDLHDFVLPFKMIALTDGNHYFQTYYFSVPLFQLGDTIGMELRSIDGSCCMTITRSF